MFVNEIHTFFDQLKSIPFVQSFLKECYKRKELENFETLSFQNADRFIYFLEHAENYFNQSENAPTSIKPVLLFYGMNQLIKTCLITSRPLYPENTKLLAHGVSTRKRKKQSYSFLLDEVKIQQYGLFPYFSDHLFHITQLPTDKFTMDSLLKRIPEMSDTHYFQNKVNRNVAIGHYSSKHLKIPISYLHDWHVSLNRLVDKLKIYLPNIYDITIDDDFYHVYLNSPIYPFENSLFNLHIGNQQLYLNTKKQSVFSLHEVMTHYLILYNLSMICRYETEWWGELLHTYGSNDFSYIIQFLKITEQKTPIMLGYYLLKQFNDCYKN